MTMITGRKVTHWRDYIDPVAVFDALGWPDDFVVCTGTLVPTDLVPAARKSKCTDRRGDDHRAAVVHDFHEPLHIEERR